ncbi:MAG: winged helix-turn-helix domain-containing protein [Lachnospiraceae bacterium]|nr:winged helix-turn-helix domain-containing protein [Lachnospiraceae bacterium]
MDYLSQPNLLLESLACLGRRGTGKSWEETEQRILLRKAGTDEAFGNIFDELKPLNDLLTLKTQFSENTKDKRDDDTADAQSRAKTDVPEADEDLFRSIEGLPCNVLGLCSPAFLLFAPVLNEFDGDVTALAERIAALPPSQISKNILDILSGTMDISLKTDRRDGEAESFGQTAPAKNLSPDTPSHADLCAATVPPQGTQISADIYMRTVLSLNLPDLSKLKLLNLYNNYRDTARRAAACIVPLSERLRQEAPAIKTLISYFADGMRTIPQDDFFGYLAHIKSASRRMDSIRIRLHPFLLGLDTVLAFPASDADDTIDIYCGFLRDQLTNTNGSQPNLADRVFNSYRLLGDRTRYDILCYLKDHPAYGQELSFKFGLARNTIHHHMSKLVEADLVSTTVRGNRVYYTLNTNVVGEFLDDQQKLLRPKDGTAPAIPKYGRPYLPYI